MGFCVTKIVYSALPPCSVVRKGFRLFVLLMMDFTGGAAFTVSSTGKFPLNAERARVRPSTETLLKKKV